jgi:uncharacterized protein YceH (UPF0502 family)
VQTILTDVEIRVLGALIEKQVTTPEYYPLSLNALTLACNQKNNRNPVTAFDEATVMSAVEDLREKNLTYVFYGSNSRVPKYKHVMPEVLHLSPQEVALMCVLMLRGPQTLGELKDRGARLYEFQSLEEVETTLNSLATRDPDKLVVRLPRQPGQKEAGEVAIDSLPEPRTQAAVAERSSDRVSRLESEIETLKQGYEELRAQFETFKRQFE